LSEAFISAINRAGDRPPKNRRHAQRSADGKKFIETSCFDKQLRRLMGPIHVVFLDADAFKVVS
jgi:hypothetical protein